MATLAAGLPWTTGSTCLVPGDGPTSYSDLGASAIYYSVTRENPTTSETWSWVSRLAPCIGGTPGGPGCPLAWEQLAYTKPGAHNSVVVNPCTHHPIVLDRNRLNDSIVYTIFDIHGNPTSPLAHKADEDALRTPNDNCGGIPCVNGEICRCGDLNSEDCGPVGQCLDINPRVHGAVRFDQDSGKCFLYLAYDRASPDPGHFWKVRLKILDITDESLAPNLPEIDTVDSAPAEMAWNDFSPSIVVDYFSEAVGLFYYRQESGNPCTTSYRGLIRATDGALFTDTEPLSGTFRALIAPGVNGLGHYVSGVRFTEPGRLLPAWSQPIPTNEACTKCDQDQNWSVAVFTAGVRP